MPTICLIIAIDKQAFQSPKNASGKVISMGWNETLMADGGSHWLFTQSAPMLSRTGKRTIERPWGYMVLQDY